LKALRLCCTHDIVHPWCEPVRVPLGVDRVLDDHASAGEETVEPRRPAVAVHVEHVLVLDRFVGLDARLEDELGGHLLARSVGVTLADTAREADVQVLFVELLVGPTLGGPSLAALDPDVRVTVLVLRKEVRARTVRCAPVVVGAESRLWLRVRVAGRRSTPEELVDGLVCPF
jgi:hypothetical protein